MSSIAIVLFINSVLGCRNEILIVICIDYSKEKVIFFCTGNHSLHICHTHDHILYHSFKWHSCSQTLLSEGAGEEMSQEAGMESPLYWGPYSFPL